MTRTSGTITGILGQSWRATITPWGDVVPWDDTPHLVWAIAAEDRWHFPESEASTRQTRFRGAPITETRVRVPNGDVVQRVWSASRADGVSAILMEFTNESPMSVAISLSRPDVVTPRGFHGTSGADRPWPSEDRGIDRPSLVIPLGHRSSMRAALARTGVIRRDDVAALPNWETVANGWVAIADQASRFDVPDVVDGVPLEDRIRQWRCGIAIDPPPPHSRSIEDVARWVVAHRELVRMGLATIDAVETAGAMEKVLRHVRRTGRVDAPLIDALRSGARILGRSDARAFEDFTRALFRTLARIGFDTAETDDAGRCLHALWRGDGSVDTPSDLSDLEHEELDPVAAAESEFVVWSGHDEVTLMPRGFGEFRLGVNIEAHRLLAGPVHTISLAIRWHGERPAVIWEVEGPPGLLLRSGADSTWTSIESTGEALWQVPDLPTMSS